MAASETPLLASDSPASADFEYQGGDKVEAPAGTRNGELKAYQRFQAVDAMAVKNELNSLRARLAALEAGGAGLAVPEAPAAAALNPDSLAGQFQFPAGTLLSQVEIDVTP
ncbi:MAG: hypothetical protein ACRYFV_01585 [Janthinobacterium lividum]